ncbi:alpha-glucuronidase A [Thozetella sp. PMI_491]|nr:alpha-glucuronidase A [Thozetella sp. PMI_491]
MCIAPFLQLAGGATAESGLDAWLRYAPLPSELAAKCQVPSIIVPLNSSSSSPVYTAGVELQRGIQGILGVKLSINPNGDASAIVVGTTKQFSTAYGTAAGPELEEDGFWLNTTGNIVQILGQNERGALYGAFKYLSMLSMGNFSSVALSENPHQPIRWVNQWDNLDGSIERGYGGRSIFFEGSGIKKDLSRVAQYGRLLASIRVNAIVINNVNANAALLSNVEGLARIADTLRPYGVRLAISLNFASPQQGGGGLSTSDPLDSGVISFWTKKTDAIYQRIPDFAGYLVKANSEGQPGPLTYKRTLAQGANMFAKALKPHGGIIMFRAFVYDQLQYNNWKADRANAAVDFFNGLDGKFDDNVVVQVKYGPIDFQVREPPSPLFAHLTETNAAIELQVTQEYLGQQCHLAFLPPLWKTILDFDLRVDGQPSAVKDILSGKRFKRPLGGSAAVVNVGTHDTWLGSHLSMSNLYSYGRMAWDPSEDITNILQDWTRLTFGLDPAVTETVRRISMDSWPAIENYTGNLGVQSLTDILGTHYGPNPASQDGNGWGQWTRADRSGIGMDRTIKNGTGNAGQYPAEVAKTFDSLETTPDELLLWFHHVPYTYKLKSGKTVIQHFYDAHYEGAKTAQGFPIAWESLQGKMDDDRFKSILAHLSYQAGHAIVWRDAINRFYHDLSRTEDGNRRVGNGTWRIEAESMTLKNYRAASANPSIAASNGKLVTASGGEGTATAKLDFPDGKYDIAVGYFDVNGGKAHWEAYINEDKIGEWTGDNEDRLFHATSNGLDGNTAARITFREVSVKNGDTIRIVGKPNGNEAAPLDYVAIIPPGGSD